MIILLVDDDLTDATLVGHILTRQDPDITIIDAETCEEALRLAKTPPDCIVMDQRLVGLSGSECVKRLREHGYRGAFILVTGFVEERTAVEAMKNGADDYISKNDVRERLLPAIKDAIARRADAVRLQRIAEEGQKEMDGIFDQMDRLRERLKRERS